MNKIIQKDCEYILNNIDIEKLANKKLLITGIAGFLGYNFYNVIKYANDTILKERECKLCGIDNFIIRKPDWLIDTKDIKIIKFDVTKPNNLYMNQDYIIHAASIASPTFYRENPIKTIDANILGLKNILEYSKDDLKSILFFSTSEIYGDPDKKHIPTSEDYNGNVSCVGPRSCYDESKRCGEAICMAYYRKYNKPIKIVRPFNNYGPGLYLDDKRVIPDFCKNLLEGNDLKIYSNGLSTRTFCYVSDAMIGYFKILLSNYNGEVFNIGNDKDEMNIKDLAKIISNYGDVEIKFENNKDENYNTDCPKRRCPNISKARKLLGYDPKISIEYGIKKTITWYKEVGN